MTPAWLLDVAAAFMLVVAALSAARLAVGRPWQPRPWRPRPRQYGHGATDSDTDVAHLLMAVAMAGMLTATLRTLPGTAWEVIFGLLTAWFAIRVARDARRSGVRALANGHRAPHLVHSASMLYMFLAMTATTPATSGTSGMDMPAGTSMMTLRYPTLALLFAFTLVGYGIWDLDQLSARRYSLATVSAGTAALATPGQAVTAQATAVPANTAQANTAPASTAPASTGQPAPTPGPPSPPAAGPAAFLLSPAVTIACRITMGVAMALMLFVAI